MKILHAIFCLNTGGAETMLVDIVNEQCKNNNVFLVIINNKYSEELLSCIDKKVRVYKIQRPEGGRNPLKILNLNYFVLKINPDVIHCHNANIAKLLLCRRKRLFLTVHDTMQSIKYYELYRKIFAISNAVKEYINKSKCFYNVKVIPNGININSVISKNNPLGYIFRIVQVGRLYTKYKGQDILLKSVSILVKKGIKNISVDFIGEGDSKEYLQNLAKELSIAEYVNFLGLKDREYIYSHLQEYDLLVQPSIYEGFGLTVAEAMAAKVPVLVSNIEGPMEIIASGKYGSYFNVSDYNECALKIEEIQEHYPQYLEIAQIGYTYVSGKYSIQETAKKYLIEYLG